MRNAKAVWHKNDDAVSPVIGTILMVAITVVLAAVLWLMVSGMLSTESNKNITVNLQSPNVQAATRTNVCYDATLNVNKITPKDEKVLWSEIRIIVKGSDGSVLQTAHDLALDGSVAYADPATPEYWYVETTGDTKLGAGDAIKITGMPTSWEGASVELTKAGERIAEASLPTDFV
jgi:flagellin-like protein